MDKLNNSTITIERDIPARGHNCTIFISDLDIMRAPVGAMASVDAAFERFRHELCSILDISEEQ
jgi:hypothetical protein